MRARLLLRWREVGGEQRCGCGSGGFLSAGDTGRVETRKQALLILTHTSWSDLLHLSEAGFLVWEGGERRVVRSTGGIRCSPSRYPKTL